MPVLISHPTGNVFFRAAAQGLFDAGKLHSLYTALAVFPGSGLNKLAGLPGLNELRRRSLPLAFKPFTHTFPWQECGRLLAQNAGIASLTHHERGLFSVDAVYAGLDKYVATQLGSQKASGLKAVYAYEDGAIHSFKKAKRIGLRCFYDLPIGHWRAMHSLLLVEKEVNPAWAVTLGGLADSAEKLHRKDEELQLADIIFAASSFTMETLKGFPGTLPAVQLVPYGFPPAVPKPYRPTAGRLKLLFVGGLSQRKGLSYLFEAVNALGSRVALTVLGNGNVQHCRPLQEALLKHRWIKTLPHGEVLTLMRAHDVLVFPSLFEGFGQVITEAMAQGTPVITTNRTAGPDIITHGKNGWIVEAASTAALQQCLEELLLNPEAISAAGSAAVQKAAQRPWPVYSLALASAIQY